MNTLHLAFRVGSAEYVLPATEVLHMEAYEERSTEVPGTASWVHGLVQVRGRVVPLLDLRRRFGLPPITPEEQRSLRIIVVEHGPRVVGLLADSAREVLKLEPAAFKPPPEMVRDGAEGFIRSITIHKDRMLMLLDLSKVLGDVGNDDEQR
jgi:purine-binding chemotaxis protein CheW